MGGALGIGDVLDVRHRPAFELAPPAPRLGDCLQHMRVYPAGVRHQIGRRHDFRLPVALADAQRDKHPDVLP